MVECKKRVGFNIYERYLNMLKFLSSSAILLTCTFASATDAPVVRFDNGNFVTLIDVVGDTTISELNTQIMASDEKELLLYISSPGGSVMALNSLRDVMRASGKTFTCFVDFAASAAFTLTQMCDVRLVSPFNSTMMQHQASYGLGRADQNNQDSFYNYVKTIISEFTEHERVRIGSYSEQEYMDIIRHDWWLTGKQAVDANVADGFANATCTPRLVKQRKTVIFPTFFGDVEVIFSQCPLIKAPLEIKFPWDMAIKDKMQFRESSSINRVWGFADVKRSVN